MEFFHKLTNINFLKYRNHAAILSVSLFLFSIVSLSVFGLNWGLDFTGGMQIQMESAKNLNILEVRNEVGRLGLEEYTVQSFGNSKNIVINVKIPDIKQTQENNYQTYVVNTIKKSLPYLKIKAVEFVGPKVGSELAKKGLLAVFVALVGIMMYITSRFEYKYAIGAIVALVHDPILILGVFSIFGLEFNLNVLAAVLAVLGYSLNDTIVIFDRIRENFSQKFKKNNVIDIVNLSINQTLSRTVILSAITLTIVVTLYLFGSAMLKGFSIAMMLGVVIGTYSSIYIAGAVCVLLGISPIRKKIEISTKPNA